MAQFCSTPDLQRPAPQPAPPSQLRRLQPSAFCLLPFAFSSPATASLPQRSPARRSLGEGGTLHTWAAASPPCGLRTVDCGLWTMAPTPNRHCANCSACA
jgi:hypothetical protein